jgi:predicted ATP-grasp superfamily ATP-dependent carboligase
VSQGPRILVLGASARAAAFSALRAGLVPWCADLFADRDLRRVCEVAAVRAAYPHTLLDMLRGAPPGPWMYTGGLENHPRLVRAMSRQRELWGCDADALELARDPFWIAEAFHAAGLPCPEVRGYEDALPNASASPGKEWLVKPLRGAGGRGISYWTGEQGSPGGKCYLQELIEGEAAAAIYVGDGRSAQLLGLTRQLIGSAFCNAAAFHYCGSVGPLEVGPALGAALQRIGDVLTAACQLPGLFGVDGVLRDGVFWPVEVNPRYTASVEVLEHATGLRALARHRAVFDATAPHTLPPARADGVVGKAIVMARRDVVFPDPGPWDAGLRGQVHLDEMPGFADIPWPGERIRTGRPVMTLLARAGGVGDCVRELERRAVELDRGLFGA